MPPGRKSQKELFRDLSSQFRRAARKPNINGYVPHEKQTAFHSSKAKIRAFLGANRSGKTVAGICEGVYYSTGKHPFKQTPEPPTQGRIIGADFTNAIEKILRPEFARWLPLSEIKGGSWEHGFSKETRVLTLENGSTVEFMSSEQHLDTHAGASRTWVHFDEEMPYEYYVENKMRLLDQNGDMWLTLTPLEGMSGWLYDDVYLLGQDPENAGKIECFTVEMMENPHLALAEAQSLLVGMTDDEIEARQKGKFVQIGGLIYPQFDVNFNVIDPFLPTPNYLHVASLDAGLNNPTAWLWGAVDKEGRLFIYDEHYESGKIVSYHAQKVHEKNQEHCTQVTGNIMPTYYVGDPSIRNRDPITGTSILLEYMEAGIPIVLGNNDVSAGINRVARYIKDHEGNRKLYITRNCVNTIREIQRYRWGLWTNNKVQRDRNKKEEPHKKDDHSVDSLRYLIASRPEVDDGSQVPQYTDYQSVGASVAVSAVGRVDEGINTLNKNKNFDPQLGDDW